MNLDQNEGLFPEAVAELHIVTDLVLSATKQAARSISRSMLVMERHLWLNLSGIRESDNLLVHFRE